MLASVFVVKRVEFLAGRVTKQPNYVSIQFIPEDGIDRIVPVDFQMYSSKFEAL